MFCLQATLTLASEMAQNQLGHQRSYQSEVRQRGSGIIGIAHIADDFTIFDLITRLNRKLIQMSVEIFGTA